MSNENFYFENTSGNHSKFWAVFIVKSDNSHWFLIRRWGKISENGRVMQERFYNHYDAENKRDKLIEEKRAKGYQAVL